MLLPFQISSVFLTVFINLSNGLNATNLLMKIEGLQQETILPPTKDGPLRLEVSFYIMSVNVDEARQEFSFDFYLRQTWKDPRLTVDDFNDTCAKRIKIPVHLKERLWLPDSHFENAIEGKFHTVTVSNEAIWLSPDGTLLWSQRVSMRSACPMDFHLFPMDYQSCYVNIGSYGHTACEITYWWALGKKSVIVKNADALRIPSFYLHTVKLGKKIDSYDTGDFETLVITIVLERRVFYYLVKDYFPAILVTMLSWISFWINPDSPPARVSFGITTVLAMTTLVCSGFVSFPKASYIKALDIYLIGCYVFVFLAIVEYAMLHFRKLQWNKNKVFSSTQRDVSLSISSLSERKQEVQNCEHQIQDEKSSTTETNQHIKGRQPWLDHYARIAFPVSFFIFNTIYWVYYLHEKYQHQAN